MHVRLSVAGKHNVANALACIALCSYYEIDKNTIYSALLKFTGASRRLEYIGSYHNVSVYDDYGHHPTEITAVCKAIADKDFRESWVIFQPHTYSRTKNLLDEFARSLLGFDNIIVTDIYAAREQNNENISSVDLVKKIKEYGKVNQFASKTFQEMLEKTIAEYNERRKHLDAEEAGEAQEQASEDIIKNATEQALNILQQMNENRESFRKIGLTFEEKAFYDILIALRNQYNLNMELIKKPMV